MNAIRGHGARRMYSVATSSRRVAGGEEVIASNGKSFPKTVTPARREEFDTQPHQNPSRDRDWNVEIRNLYRDLIKSIPIQKERFRLALPEEVVKANIRKLFEEGEPIKDEAALRHRVLMHSADVEEYFRHHMFDVQVLGKYNSIDNGAMLKKELDNATKPTQGAHRFFNEGSNILLEAGIGIEDVTENRVYMTREAAYKKGIAAMDTEGLVQLFGNGLDTANKATLEAIASTTDFKKALEAAALAAEAVPNNMAEGYVARCEAFSQAMGVTEKAPVGDAIVKAWEEYCSIQANVNVLCSEQFKALMADPVRNPLVRGPADKVELAESGTVPITAEDAALGKVAAHLYYSDQLPSSWGEDLGASYLADLKGADRRFDLLLDQEIALRKEQMIRVKVATCEAMKAAMGSGSPSTHNWTNFSVPLEGPEGVNSLLEL